MNDATNRPQTKLKLLQALARRHMTRPGLALKARLEACPALPVKPSPKALPTPA
ncbi:MAG TPA: hypothetical protein PK640_14300 [Verrucomicrobiota bacterium]|nr:hypothetical protein [Verrucomicrobiota bacterium]